MSYFPQIVHIVISYYFLLEICLSSLSRTKPTLLDLERKWCCLALFPFVNLTPISKFSFRTFLLSKCMPRKWYYGKCKQIFYLIRMSCDTCFVSIILRPIYFLYPLVASCGGTIMCNQQGGFFCRKLNLPVYSCWLRPQFYQWIDKSSCWIKNVNQPSIFCRCIFYKYCWWYWQLYCNTYRLKQCTKIVCVCCNIYVTFLCQAVLHCICLWLVVVICSYKYRKQPSCCIGGWLTW